MRTEAITKTNLTLGQRMQARRRQLGLSMKRLAAEVGVCEKTISNWERDECCFPVNKLITVCRVLHWTPNKLLGIDGDLDAKPQSGFSILVPRH
jgi:transcriptional regulator with XRE-family HTH domain